MNAITTNAALIAGPDSARAASTTSSAAGAASRSGAADGALIGLAVGAVFGIATVWPISLAAVVGGVIIGATGGAALAYLDHAVPSLPLDHLGHPGPGRRTRRLPPADRRRGAEHAREGDRRAQAAVA